MRQDDWPVHELRDTVGKYVVFLCLVEFPYELNILVCIKEAILYVFLSFGMSCPHKVHHESTSTLAIKFHNVATIDV